MRAWGLMRKMPSGTDEMHRSLPDPVAIELEKLRQRLEDSIELYQGYRDAAAERALRITQLVTKLNDRDAKLRQLEQQNRDLERKYKERLKAAEQRYQQLSRRRSVRAVILLASIVRLVRSMRATRSSTTRG